MTDIFDEVGEDLRRDRLKNLWQRYSWLVFGVAILIVVVTAAWRGYEAWTENRAASAGDAYADALAGAKAGDHAALAGSLAAYASGAPSQYALLARFRAASEHAAAGETDNALATFDDLAKDSAAPAEFRDLAAIRAAMIAVDREDLGKMKDRLGAYLNDISPWRHAARELVALAAIKAQDWTEAGAAVRKLSDDPATPADVRSRTRILEGLVTAAKGSTGAGS